MGRLNLRGRHSRAAAAAAPGGTMAGKTLPNKFKWLRRAVAILLKDYPNALYDAHVIAAMLNAGLGVKDRDDITAEFSKTMLVDAFCNGGLHEYAQVYGHLAGFEDDDESVLYVRMSDQEEFSGERVAAFGRFNSLEQGSAALVVDAIAYELPNDAQDELVALLRKETARLEKKREVTPPPPGNAATKKQCLETPGSLEAKLKEQLASITKLSEELAEAKAAAAETRAKLLKLRKEEEMEELDEESSNEGANGTKDTALPVCIDAGVQMQYLLEGRAGTVKLGPGGILFADDLVAGLSPLPYEDNEEHRRIRLSKQWDIEDTASVQIFVPRDHLIYSKSHFSRLKKSVRIVEKLKWIFGGPRCRLSNDAMRIITSFMMHNYGGSDVGGEQTIAGAYGALLYDLGIGITPEQLGKACPCETFLVNWEKEFAVECFVARCQRMNDIGVRRGSMSSDHGHRNGQDALAKILAYAYIDEDGNRRVEDLCLDMDTCGHSAEEVVEAIATSWNRVLRLCPDVELIAITGDSGGGGAVQTIHPLLVERGIMVGWSRFAQCWNHGLQKCLQRGCEAAFGTQGMGKKTCFQLIFQAVLLFKAIKDRGGLKLLDGIHQKVMDTIMSKPEWQLEAGEKFGALFEKFWEKMNGTDVDNIVQEMLEVQRNLQAPVWTRWGTSIKGGRFVIEHWTEIVFTAITIAQSEETSSSYLTIVAKELLVMMNTRAPSPDGSGSGTPLFYVQLSFVIAVDDAFFGNYFDMAMRADPEFGRGSHGKNSRLCIERLYLIQRKLSELMTNDGWKNCDDFREFFEAASTLPKLGDIKEGGQEFFLERAPKVFFDEFLASYNKMLVDQSWRTEKLVVYIIWGNPVLAKMFLRWLVYVDAGGDPKTYDFPSEPVELEHHDSNGKSITVDSRKCLDYLTGRDAATRDRGLPALDPTKILTDPLITEQQELLWKMAADPNVVDLFDSTTWGEELDYLALLDLGHEAVAIHPSQNQLTENHIQTFKHISKTNVKEVRRSCRALLHSIVMRTFNRTSVDAKRARKAEEDDATPADLEKITRVKGSERTMLFYEHTVGMIAEVNRALSLIDGDVFDAVYEDITSQAKKSSAEALEARLQKVEESFDKPRNMVASELNHNGMDVTAQMGGKIVLSVLTQTAGDTPLIDAEIAARGIDLTEKQLKGMKIADKKEQLKIDEMKCLVSLDEATPEHYSKISEITPQSDELKAFFPEQSKRQLEKQNKKASKK